MNSKNPYQVVSTKIMYENPWMRVREDAVIRPDGTNGIYGIMESDDSVVIVALNNHAEVYLVKSYSYPAAAWSWTLPGGGGNKEHPMKAAKRELAEETGIVASEWVSLGKTRIAGGIITERTTFILARDVSLERRPAADDSYVVGEGKFVAIDRIGAMIDRGEIDDCQSITGIYLAQRWLTRYVLGVATN